MVIWLNYTKRKGLAHKILAPDSIFSFPIQSVSREGGEAHWAHPGQSLQCRKELGLLWTKLGALAVDHVRAEWIDLWQVCHSLEMWPLGAPAATSTVAPEPILGLLLYVPIRSSLLVLHLCLPIQQCTASPLHGPALQSSHKRCVGAIITNPILPEPEAQG